MSASSESPFPPRLLRTRLYEQVAAQITTWVTDNDLAPGDRLPPERELAARLGVSRATLSQALVALEVIGAVSVRHGDGTVVTRVGAGLAPGRDEVGDAGTRRTVEAIRARFTERRKGVGTLDRVLRRLLGLDAKMAQYRDGAAFVRGVVDRVGMAEFNAVWAGPENLPTKAELADHDAWVARVL